MKIVSKNDIKFHNIESAIWNEVSPVYEDVDGHTNVPWWYSVLDLVQKFRPHPRKIWPFPSHPLLDLIPFRVLPCRILLPFAKRRIHSIFIWHDSLPERVNTDGHAELDDRSNKSIWDGDNGDGTVEVDRIELASCDIEVRGGSENVIPAFTIKGSTQLSVQ